MGSAGRTETVSALPGRENIGGSTHTTDSRPTEVPRSLYADARRGSPMKLQVQAASIAVGDCIGSHPIAQIGFPIAVVAEGRPIDRVMCARGAVLPGTEGGVTNLIRRAPHAWI